MLSTEFCYSADKESPGLYIGIQQKNPEEWRKCTRGKDVKEHAKRSVRRIMLFQQPPSSSTERSGVRAWKVTIDIDLLTGTSWRCLQLGAPTERTLQQWILGPRTHEWSENQSLYVESDHEKQDCVQFVRQNYCHIGWSEVGGEGDQDPGEGSKTNGGQP